MDVSTISDLAQLKALAYDEIAKKEHAERNLAAINARIETVFTEQAGQTEQADQEQNSTPEQPAKDAVAGLAASTDNPSSLIGDSASA